MPRFICLRCHTNYALSKKLPFCDVCRYVYSQEQTYTSWPHWPKNHVCHAAREPDPSWHNAVRAYENT